MQYYRVVGMQQYREQVSPSGSFCAGPRWALLPACLGVCAVVSALTEYKRSWEAQPGWPLLFCCLNQSCLMERALVSLLAALVCPDIRV